MNTISQVTRTTSTLVALAIWFAADQPSHAHMAWLATDDQDHACLWFGESPADRTYHLPEAIAGIQLSNDGGKTVIKAAQIDTDTLVGIRSKSAIQSSDEIVGSVTYGLYHGTKLTYHVEHLPGGDSSTWPTQPRDTDALQTVITPTSSGGVTVMVLLDRKPLADVEVKLFCQQGHQEAASETDAAGLVTFKAAEVESGLNAVMVNLTDKRASGELDGESFTSTTDIVTATFMSGAGGITSADSNPTPSTPQVDPNSGASIKPAALPELPELLTSFGAAIANDNIYVYGGHTGEAHSYSIDEQSDRLWSLDRSPNSDRVWKQIASGPRLQGLALVADGDRLIRIGGFTALNETGEPHQLESQTSVAQFDLNTKTWSDLSPLPEPRSSLDAVVLGDHVYVVGGWALAGDRKQGSWHQTAWSLDLSDRSATWQPIAKPPFQRRAISAAAHGGKLYVIGGMQSEGGPTTSVAIYDPQADVWQVGPPLPGTGMSGFGSSSFATGGNLYVSAMDGFIHQLSQDTKHWITIAKDDSARFFHRMLPISDQSLLMIGGANMETGKFSQIDLVQIR